MDGCSMTVTIHPGLHCTWTATSITRLTSLTWILSVNYVWIVIFPFSLNCNRRDNIKFVGCLSTRFGVWKFYMARTTIAHAQTKSHVSQFVQWNAENADIYQIRYMNAFQRVMTSQFSIWLSVPLATQEQSPFHRPILISRRCSAREAICRGESLQV